MSKDHDYKADTVIHLHLGIGISNAYQKDNMTLEDLTGLSQEKLDKMSESEIVEAIESDVTEWAYNYIDTGWSAGAEE